jgi:hypothetical protein
MKHRGKLISRPIKRLFKTQRGEVSLFREISIHQKWHSAHLEAEEKLSKMCEATLGLL